MKVRARALDGLMSLPIAERLPVVAEGLRLLAEHIIELDVSARALRDVGRTRSANILDGVLAEESAKVLILLDIVRMGWGDRKSIHRQISYFSSHIARGVYAEVAASSVASFSELKEMADYLRVERYLDGPNDVDWEYRNRIESKREEALYVDYIEDEDGYRWVSPADAFIGSYHLGAAVADLIGALTRLGLLKLESLRVIQNVWQGIEMRDSMQWADLVRINQALHDSLNQAGLVPQDASRVDWALVVEQWVFPMHSLDLRKLRVTDADLECQRNRAHARMSDDWS